MRGVLAVACVDDVGPDARVDGVVAVAGGDVVESVARVDDGRAVFDDDLVVAVVGGDVAGLVGPREDPVVAPASGDVEPQPVPELDIVVAGVADDPGVLDAAVQHDGVVLATSEEEVTTSYSLFAATSRATRVAREATHRGVQLCGMKWALADTRSPRVNRGRAS
ncbi:hypothetical protein [Plesiocystis pacifica]|uniref:hypothetical protein n=1 Tax=Plesiocystis pacifica TaxID=191768 RepID=UPI0012FCB84A|nr:hypothetical protein [Plesiocystis pacifica]